MPNPGMERGFLRSNPGLEAINSDNPNPHLIEINGSPAPSRAMEAHFWTRLKQLLIPCMRLVLSK